MKKNNYIVSVIMPIYNEEKYIETCIKTLLKQSFPKEEMEVFFVDGGSTDGTKQIVEKYIKENPELFKLLENNKKIAPVAMNIGIKASSGKYIVRLDAHAEYPDDYIYKCVKTLEETNAENVGGVAITRSKSKMGGYIAKVLSSKFGVGNSKFRTNGKSGFVDTVPFGTFKRDVFDRWGGFDERLVRNQDNEINYRIRKNGGKVYLSSEINFYYYCRDNIKDLVKMAVANGKWNIFTMKICPGTMGLRHFVPLMFFLSIIVGSVLSWIFEPIRFIFLGEIILYGILDIFFSFKTAEKKYQTLFIMCIYPIFHISYGLGSMIGLLKPLKL